MSYEVTATRKRPSSFDSLAGQEFVVAALKNSVQSGRIAHAYLFSGPRGVGKTSAARILAKSLNCVKGPTTEPCGVCANCVEISRGNSLDVIEIDGASNTGVDNVRQIKDEILFAPNTSRYKIYIIDEVHMLTGNAFNALLKTIEEPPPYIVFIFATTEIHKVPLTIHSRCQPFKFRVISLGVIHGLLKSLCAEMGLTAQDDALLWIAKEADGSLRDAYTRFDQVVSFCGNEITFQKLKDKFGFAGLDRLNEFCALLAGGKTGESFLFLDELFTAGVSAEQFIRDITEYFRNLLLLKLGIRKEAILGYTAESFSSAVVSAFEARQIEKALWLLFELYRTVRYSPNQRFEIELAVARLADLKNYVSPQELAERIFALRKELKTGFTVQADSGGDGGSFGTAGGGGAGDASPVAAGSREASGADEAASPPLAADDISHKRNAVIQNLRKSKLVLSSYLEKANLWQIEGNALGLYVDENFLADSIRGNLACIENEVREVFGRELKVVVHVREAENKEAGEEPRVEMAARILHGEVIQ
jgi:DNA polymerase-3 subunit gamma/tau